MCVFVPCISKCNITKRGRSDFYLLSLCGRFNINILCHTYYVEDRNSYPLQNGVGYALFKHACPPGQIRADADVDVDADAMKERLQKETLSHHTHRVRLLLFSIDNVCMCMGRRNSGGCFVIAQDTFTLYSPKRKGVPSTSTTCQNTVWRVLCGVVVGCDDFTVGSN